MTIRNLDALFEPRAIALIGASNQPDSVGAVLARNLFDSGFSGPVMPVNPHEVAIRSAVNHRSVVDLPLDPDLAVIATPPPTVPRLIAELGARGCRAAVVITAGVTGAHRQEMLDAAKPHLMRIVGPNCIGFISPARGINASFAHLTPKAGDLAFISQSGAIATAVLDWTASRDIGFSHVVSVGDMSDVDLGDLLDYLALDPKTRAILLYAEAITHVPKFMSAARIAARTKPVVVIKTGRSEAGARAALSHTGALAGADAVYDAAFRRAGMLRVDTLRQLFEAVATLASGIRPRGDRLAIVTNGGGAGVLATDALAAQGGRPARLSDETVAKLDAALPATWSHANPVDILGDAPGRRYSDAVAAVLADPGQDAVLVMNCPTAVASGLDAAEAVVAAAGGAEHVPLLTCWLGEPAARPARDLFALRGIPSYETPDEAVRAFMYLVRYRKNQDLLMQTPRAVGDAPVDLPAARGIVEAALREGRTVLTEPEAKRLLAAFGVTVLETRIAASADEAADAAAAIGFPVVLKILSDDISHKSDVGGVRLDLGSVAAVREAAEAMLARVRAALPEARLKGFTVQRMIKRPHALELIAGMSVDPTFGPTLLFGQGGTAVEVIGDRAIGLPPLNHALALDMIGRTRISRLFPAHRDQPAVDADAVADTLVQLSGLIAALPEIVELDINPLLADETGVLALDARVVLSAAPRAAFAIRPYPTELEGEIALRSGKTLKLRPIRPEDEPAIIAMLQQSDPEDIRLRFFAPLKKIGHGFAARLTQIDYNREMAFVAEPAGDAAAILGVARLISDPNHETAEFGIMVRSDQKGQGLGYALMQQILDYAKATGLKRVHGDVLRENTTMLAMARELGFTLTPGEADIVSVDWAIP